jgi:putative addiction module component (TIGR02574 family)
MAKPTVRADDPNRDDHSMLLEQLEDSFDGTIRDTPMTDVQRRELDRRLDALDEDLARGAKLGISWEKLQARLRRAPRRV